MSPESRNEHEANTLFELETKIVKTVRESVSKIPRPFASIISGGFDSSLLTALTFPENVYRVRIPYQGFDESVYAESVVDYLDLRDKYHEMVLTPETFKENFEPAVKVMGKPTRHFSMVPMYSFMKFLHEKGEKHVLSGEGPDEYLGGYARQIIVSHAQQLLEIPELMNYHELTNVWEPWVSNPVKKYGEMMGYEASKIAKYDDQWKQGKYPLQGAIGKMDFEEGGIEEMEQKMAGHFGITLHYPYINEELAEYCYGLPDNMKIRDGVTKWAFRKICKRYLPAVLQNRPKMGGPVAPVNLFMGWTDLNPYDKTRYMAEQERVLK
jgi:asparagine synthase (glutamine-hydrolysing)